MPVVRTFLCSECGAKIENVKDFKGICKQCGAEYFIDGLKSCLEIIRSENIESGINFKPCADIIHDQIVDFLTSNEAAPLDILSSTYISSKENLCLPAYYYHYNGTSDYLCDVGNENIKHLNGKNGDIQSINETSWSTISGNIRAEVQRIASGNKNYDFITDEFYKPYQDGELPYSENYLVDIESFEIPSNAEIIPFSRPSSELLDRYVRKDMEEALKRSVLRQVGGRESRNISLGNSNIERDEKIDRVLIAMYHVNFTYKDTTYSMYVSGDGSKIKFENEAPVDPVRQMEKKSLAEEYSSVKGTSTLFLSAAIICGVIALLSLICENVVAGIIFAIVCVLGIVKRVSMNSRLMELAYKLNLFKHQIEDVKNKFIQSKNKLKNSECLEK